MAANVFSYLLSYGPKFDQVWIFEAARICWIGTEWPIYGFLYRYRLEQRTAILRTRMLRRWYLFMKIYFFYTNLFVYISSSYLVYNHILFTAESWFDFCARSSLVYFHFCLAASQDTAKFVCLPLHIHRWCFAHPFPCALSYCLYVPILFIFRPYEFCLVFASLASKALVVGQSRLSSFSSIVICCELLYVIYNTIQCGDCHRVVEQNRVKVFSATYIKWKHFRAFLMMYSIIGL